MFHVTSHFVISFDFACKSTFCNWSFEDLNVHPIINISIRFVICLEHPRLIPDPSTTEGKMVDKFCKQFQAIEVEVITFYTFRNSGGFSFLSFMYRFISKGRNIIHNIKYCRKSWHFHGNNILLFCKNGQFY